MRLRVIVPILVIVLAVVASAVYFGHLIPGTQQGSRNSSVAPTFTLSDIYGHPFALSSYRNHTVVLIEFTSLSCSECQIVEQSLKTL
jgi:hypothetical protein